MKMSPMQEIARFLKKNKSSKTKICFITCEYPPAKGGVSNSAMRVTNFLIEADYEVHVFAPNVVDSCFSLEIDGTGRYIYLIPSKYLPAYTEFISLADSILQFDLFHGFFLYWSGAFLPLIQSNCRPLISSIRGIEPIWMKESIYMKSQIEPILQRSTWITSVSKSSIKIIDEFYDISKKSSFIPNSAVAINNMKWNLNKANFGVIGTVATFREKKNIPLLIESYAQMPRESRTKLLLVGGYSDHHLHIKPQVEFLLDKYGIRNEVVITGYVEKDKVLDYLQMMHVFVISSDHEGLPNTLFEAASLGLPIVTTAVDGILDICTNNKDVLMVPIKNPPEMTKAILKLVNNPQLCRQLSSGAGMLVNSYSREYEKDAWLNLYNNILNLKNPIDQTM